MTCPCGKPAHEYNDCTLPHCPYSGHPPRWLWADGVFRNEPPPSEQEIPVTVPPILELKQTPKTGAESLWPEVPADFVMSDRHRLRMAAMGFVLQAAPLLGLKLTTKQVLDETESLERWLAQGSLKQAKEALP